jgi:hypothetical protein
MLVPSFYCPDVGMPLQGVYRLAQKHDQHEQKHDQHEQKHDHPA